MTYSKKIVVSLDQFLMSIMNGNVDCTISSTTGFFAKEKATRYWLIMQWMIDLTFYPIDGEGHCLQAYEADKDEKFEEGWKTPLAILTAFFCIVISLFTWSYWFINKIR